MKYLIKFQTYKSYMYLIETSGKVNEIINFYHKIWQFLISWNLWIIIHIYVNIFLTLYKRDELQIKYSLSFFVSITRL